MQIQLTTDPRVFAAQSRSFLTREPISANVIAVVLDRTLSGSLSGTVDDVWITVTDDDSAGRYQDRLAQDRCSLPADVGLGPQRLSGLAEFLNHG